MNSNNPEIKKNRFLLTEDEQKKNKQRNNTYRKPIDKKKLGIIFTSSLLVVCIGIFVFLLLSGKRPDILGDHMDKKESGLFSSLFSKGDGLSSTVPDVESNNPNIIRGKQYYSRGEMTSAVNEFQEVIDSDASDTDKAIALSYLGIIEDEQGNFKAAASFYERALKYDNKNIFALRSIASSLKNQKRYDEAIEYIDEAIKIDDNNADLYILKANIHYLQKKYTDAIESYEEAISLDKNNASALYNLAQTYIQTGNELRAENYLIKAASAGNGDRISAMAYSQLGNIYLKNKEYKNSIKYFEKATNLLPKESSNYFNMGLAYLNLGNNDKALEYFTIAEEKSNQDVAVLESLGEAYSSLHEYQKSIEIYNKLLRINETNTRVLLKLGDLYYKNGYINEALEKYKRASKLQPLSETAKVAFLNMGTIYDDLERYDEAIDAYQKVIAIDSNNSSAYYNLGIVYMHMGQNEKAINSWRKSSGLNPDNAKPHIAMADLLYDEGYFDEALIEYDKVSEKWPTLSEPHFAAGAIQFKKNNLDFAEKRYEKVISLNNNEELIVKSYINLASINIGKDGEEYEQKAFNYIQKALLKQPSNAQALITLGNLYYEKGSFNSAIESYYQTIKSTTDDKLSAMAYNNIGKSYYKMREYKKALQAFTMGVDADPTNEEIRLNRKAAVDSYEGSLIE